VASERRVNPMEERKRTRTGRGGWLLVVVLGWAIPATAISTTTVQGTVYLANGQPGSGTVLISWPAFTTANNEAVAADSLTTTVATDGFLSVNLAPNEGATPSGLYYTVVYHLSDGSTSTEYWVVPSAASASIAAVRATVMPAAQAIHAVNKAYVDESIAGLSSNYLSTTGGTMTGPLYLSGDPTQTLQAADKHYVDISVTSAENAALTNGTIYRVDQFSGGDFGAKLQACINGLNAGYGGTCDGRAFSGALSMASKVTISTANAVVLFPCATISTASQIVVAAGVRNVALHGCSLRGTSAASGSLGGTIFLYSGASAMFQVGDAAYATNTPGFRLDNVAINTTTSSSASAQGLVAYRTQEMSLASLYFLGNSNQTGMTLDGTGNYTGGTFLDNAFTGFQIAVNAIGHQVANTATTDWMNASTFVRLHIDCPTSGGKPVSGTIGINLAQGDGNTFDGGDVEGCNEALHLGANAVNNTIVGLRNENSTYQVYADSGSKYNSWVSGGTIFTGGLVDNGTRNSFLDTFHRSFNGLNGDWYGSQQDATLVNHYRLGTGVGNERGVQNRYQTDYGYRWTTGLSDATAGEQFYQVLDELNGVNRLSIGQYNHGASSTNNQTVVNAAGTGAVVVNGSTNAGTGGLVIGSGGASESTVATIDNAGNEVLLGNLTVNGTSTSVGSIKLQNNADAEIDYFLRAGLTTSQKESVIWKDYDGSSQWYAVKDASNNWALNSAVGGLDSFKAYQSMNSGDTYVNASNNAGVVRVNYESGSGTGFKVYGGSSSALYAAFTGTSTIQFPGLATSSGKSCLQIDNSGYITNTGATCTAGSTSGSIAAGTTGQIAYYPGAGTTLYGESTVPVSVGGTGASTATSALANLGALPITGGTISGNLTVSGSTTLNSLTATNIISGATPAIDARFYGAAGDARMGADGSVTAGATQMSSSTLSCGSADVGRMITINGAGASGKLLVATVTSCASGTAVNFTPAASTAVTSSARWVVGTDNTSAINLAINAGLTACGASVLFPHGIYLVNGNLRVSPTSAQRSACLMNNNYNWFPLRLTGDGPGSSYLVQNNPLLPLLTVADTTGSLRFSMDHIALMGRGTSTTGSLFEDISASSNLEDVSFAGSGGRCLVQQAERLTTLNVNYMSCRQAFVQAGDVGLNESYFRNTQILQAGTTVDPLNGYGSYTYNVNAVNGVFPASGSVVADMHAAVVLTPSVNILWDGGSIKPTGQGIAGFRMPGGEGIKISHFYIEGYNSPAINPAVIVGGKNETTLTTASMTAASASVTVADSSWMRSVTGNVVDLPIVGTTDYILYPPDYVYGSTVASSLGNGILKGNYEEVLAVFVNNTAYLTRAQGGTTAYAWPAGTVVNESYLNSQPTKLYDSSIVLDDVHLWSAPGTASPYSMTTNANAQEPGGEIVLGFMPDLFHTWGAGTGSDYPSSWGRTLKIAGFTRFTCGSLSDIEVHGLYNQVLTDGGYYSESSNSALTSFSGCGTGAIATVKYSNGVTSSFTLVGPQFPQRERFGNMALTTNSSGQFVMADASSGNALCTYNGTKLVCSGLSTSSVSASAIANADGQTVVNSAGTGAVASSLMTPAAFATLTDGAAVTLATAGAAQSNAMLTLSHSTATRTLNLSGLSSGAQVMVILKQDSTGGAALTLGSGCAWYLSTDSGYTASTAPSLTTTAGAINILSAVYDGTNCYGYLR